MSEEVEMIMEDAREQMDKAISHLKQELTKIRAGKATPQMLQGIMIDYYGAMSPLEHVANVNTPDARTLMIQPWEKQMVGPIEKAIMNANLGYNPQNDGTNIRINIPPLTEERRKQFVKMSRQEAEQAKVSVRTIRKEANEQLKTLVKEGLSEDEGKRAEDNVQELTDKFIKRIDEILSVKEEDIMTV